MERKESIGKDATSKDTLKDVEENEAGVSDTSDDSEMPSPDGAFDDSDELEDADPV
ncbi:MAG TPA: hypothetical protein VN659_13955 [Pyrinomonadaceae bacterium]|nr:hypothetical protein [Pyrinomonadaceae bacterium]